MAGSFSKGGNNSYDYSFKILLIGDSGVGKSSLLLSFISSSVRDLSPTIDLLGTEVAIDLLGILVQQVPAIGFWVVLEWILRSRCSLLVGKGLKLTIWDTAGQERFGTLISSYYRGAHGIILVYDVTRRETFENLSDIWAKEVELYSTNHDCIKILVGNKVDRDSERAVSREEGMALAQQHKCSFFECSAKTSENVLKCFKELTLKILEVPSLLENGSVVVKQQIMKDKQAYQAPRGGGSCCS
ncbi:DRAB5-RELATED [Salix purpurea]|uniref:DRAB5-RELATED n=1 Tax=Salix purpurea TaxID=77065 RepID=A0A9Q0UC41_SALPP|nr:DRAB5-RELATED [Salix purpurea]